MEKFKEIFLKSKLLNEQDFDELSKYAIGDIKRDTNNRLIITFELNNIVDLSVANIIVKNKHFVSTHADIIIKYKEFSDFSKINSYLTIYLQKYNIISTTVINKFKSNKFIIKDNKLEITYGNSNEKENLTSKTEHLVEFLNDYGFNLTGIEYIYISNEEEINKFKQENLKAEVIIKPESKYDDMSRQNYVSADKKEMLQLLINKATDKLGFKDEATYGVIECEIFSVKDEVRKIEGNEIYSLSLSDYVTAINCKLFTNTTDWKTREKKIQFSEEYLKTFKPGDWVRAQISIKPNKYSNNEMEGTISRMMKIDKPEQFVREDNAPKPRIELFSHTKMSAFDGICSSAEVIKRSKQYKAPAVGFADRHNIQEYPEIAKAAKSNDQKVLYGVELNLLDKITEVVSNATEDMIDNVTYVVFDLETGGLFNGVEDITEFGAVKVKNRTIVDSIDFFLKPERPLKQSIIDKTHITQEMVDGGISQKEGIKKIIEYFGNDILVAHNGINFDMRFVNRKCEKYNLPLVKNTCIDTMQISRSINKDYSNHRLGTICRKNKIIYDDSIAHRANFDAEVLTKVWMIFIEQLKQMKIRRIDEINTMLQCDKLYSSQFPDPALFYIKNKDGIKDMYETISLASTKNFFGGNPRVFKNEIKRDNLLIASSPMEGDLWDNALNGTDQELIDCANFYDFIFVSPPSAYNHEISRDNISLEETKQTIKRIINIANKIGKPVCAVSGNFYLDIWDQVAHNVYIHNKLLGGRPHRFFKYGVHNVPPMLFYRTTQEMIEEFSFLEDSELINNIVIENTYKFNDACEKIKIGTDGLYTPSIPGSDEKFNEVVWKNVKDWYGENPDPIITNRVKEELELINSKGYTIIYYICYLLVQKSNEEGYVVGSRGSVGSSAVAFFGQVGEVNPLAPHYVCPNCKHHEFIEGVDDGFDLPLKVCPVCGKEMKSDGHNIPFVTFLGTKGAEKIPDIDMNFSGEYQPKAHMFIHDMFGNDKAFKAGTVLTVADKTAYGYTKTYFEISQPEYRPTGAEIDWIASKCVGTKRTNGQHAGGMIVCPNDKPMTDFTPYNYPPEGDSFGWYTTHFDYHSIDSNLLKFDILGHDYPSLLKYMEDISGVSHFNIKYNDNKVIQLFEGLESLNLKPEDINGQTIGTFAIPECGTNFTIKMIQEAKPKSFADLIRISGLSHGTDVWNGNARDLILRDGKRIDEVVSVREGMFEYFDKMGVPQALGFKIAESVRKGKKIPKDAEPILREHNVPEWFIESCNKIKYLFPKAHATAYMIASYNCGWYKIYYPMAFYSAFFTYKRNAFDVITMISGKQAIIDKLEDIKKRMSSRDRDIKKTVTAKEEGMIDLYNTAIEMIARGYTFKTVDLMRSDATKFLIDGKTLICPFNAIDGLGEEVANSIVEQRSIKPFISKADLSSRTKVNKKHMEEFSKLHVLDGMEEDSQLSLNSLFE